MAVAQPSTRGWVWQRTLPIEAACRTGAGLAIAVYVAVFARLTFDLFDRLGTTAFDMGIFDQAVWLISRGQVPFVTLRGLHILADHFSAVLYLLAPFYWFWPSPKLLLFVQTVGLGLGALPVYALARERTRSAPTALLFATAYLLYPAMQWSNVSEFHPDTLATPLLLAALYCLTQGRWRWYFVTLVMAALTKETVGLTIVVLGVYAFFTDRRIGLLTVALGTTALVVAMETVRWFNHGVRSPYLMLYAGYGDSLPAIAWHLMTHPLSVAALLGNSVHGQYLFQLLAPLLFLPLLAPEMVLLAAPALLANVLSRRPAMHDIQSYYTALITPFLVIGAVIGYQRLQERSGPFLRQAVLANLVLWSVAGTLWGPLWKDRELLDATLRPAAVAEAKRMLARIPPDASVSAQMVFGPQLAHRTEIFNFPNPFSRNAWGGTRKARWEIESISLSQVPSQRELAQVIPGARVDYVLLWPLTNRFPLSLEAFTACVMALLRSPAYGIVAIGNSTLLLERGADRRRGLRLLEERSRRQIAGSDDLVHAYWAWLARGSDAAASIAEARPAGISVAGGADNGDHLAVLTQHNDNARTGANLKETVLHTGNLNVRLFGKLFARRVDGHIYAQPLYVPHLFLPGKGVHRVVFVATMHNSVYAFDADDPRADTPLWRVNLGPAVPAADVQSVSDIAFEVGILSTPVVDASTNTLYLVSKTKRRQSFFSAVARYEQRLHALDLATGAEKFGGPVEIEATVPGRGDGGDTLRFDARIQNQRPALLLSNGTLYISWASHSGSGPYHGWVMAYDAATLRRRGAFVTTPNGEQGGIWQSGQGPAADGSGEVFLATGNGSFDADVGGSDLGNCILKLRLGQHRLFVSDWFAPHDVVRLSAANMDLSSSGPLLILDNSTLVNGSKSGILYVLDRRRLGRFHADDDRGGVQTLKASAGHIHGSPVYWKNRDQGPMVYVWGASDHLKAFRVLARRLLPTPVHQSSMRAPEYMPGGVLSLSANGDTPGTGILWASLPYRKGANHRVVPGILRAFDASDVSRELWNSKENVARDDVGSFAKFCAPTVANGKVYLATFSCQLVVYGLQPGGA